MLTKTNENQVILTNTTYDFTKKLVQIILPAISTFYFSLAGIWGLPYGEQVVGTIACITTFLGATLIISHNRYKESDAAVDGDAVVTRNGDRAVVSLELNEDAHELVKNKVMKFRVRERRERPLTVDDIEDDGN